MHSVQLTLFGSWYLPAAQAEQSEEPLVLTLPNSQRLQEADPSSEYMFARHGLHSLAHAPA